MNSIIPPTAVRHRIIAVSVLMAFILYLDRICLAEIVKAASFKGEMQLSKEEIGRILGAFFFTYAIFQVPAGWASDRWGARRMLTLYIVLWSVFTALTGLVSGFWGLLLMRLLCGASEAGAYPTSSAVIRRWIPTAQRARASGIVSFGGRLGGALAPFITAWLVVRLGHWRPALWIDGGVGLVIAALYWKIVRERPTEHPACNEAERRLIGSPANEAPLRPQEFFIAVGAFCRSRSLWLSAASQLFTNLGWAFLITWLPTYLTEQRHVEPVEGGRMVSLVLGIGMTGQLAGGALSDWSVRRFGLRWGRVLPITIASVFAAGGYLLCLPAGSVGVIVACCALVSFSTDLMMPSVWAFMQDVGGRVTAAAAGWGNMWGNFGASLISMLVPWLLKVGGDTAGQRVVFLVCAGSFLLAGLAALGMNAAQPLLINNPAPPSPDANPAGPSQSA